MKTSIRTEKKITVRVEREDLEKLLRKAVDAPENATVDFDGSFLDHADVIWSEHSLEEDADD